MRGILQYGALKLQLCRTSRYPQPYYFQSVNIAISRRHHIASKCSLSLCLESLFSIPGVLTYTPCLLSLLYRHSSISLTFPKFYRMHACIPVLPKFGCRSPHRHALCTHTQLTLFSVHTHYNFCCRLYLAGSRIYVGVSLTIIIFGFYVSFYCIRVHVALDILLFLLSLHSNLSELGKMDGVCCQDP